MTPPKPSVHKFVVFCPHGRGRSRLLASNAAQHLTGKPHNFFLDGDPGVLRTKSFGLPFELRVRGLAPEMDQPEGEAFAKRLEAEDLRDVNGVFAIDIGPDMRALTRFGREDLRPHLEEVRRQGRLYLLPDISIENPPSIGPTMFARIMADSDYLKRLKKKP